MEHSSEFIKAYANRLAELALSKDRIDFVRMLSLAGLLGGPASAAEPAARKGPDRVGIWERKNEKGRDVFVRSNDMAGEWHLWAGNGRIEPKQARRRVVLIGESVARGYLYDPQFNPAMALQNMLQSQLGKVEIEVTDLARTNLKWEIRELAHQALLLEPDAVVIFAGNNWNAEFSSKTDLSSLREVLAQQGIPGLKKFIEDRLASEVRRLVDDIASTCKAKDIPVIWIVPEFNLVDWRDADTSVPYLPNEAHLDWMHYQEQAQRAIENNAFTAASELARKMVELDHGVNAQGRHILAEYSRRTEDLEAARYWLEQARDATIWDLSRVVSPRCYSVTQNALREQVAKHHNSHLVDLPAIFKQYLRGEIPDRRLFLDFCHLTVQGIEVAMAAASSSLINALTGQQVPWRALLLNSAAPSRQAQAEGAFLAAIHNAHHHQPFVVVEHHIQMALQMWPGIARIMTYFLELQTRRTPMLMCKSAEQIAGFGSPLVPNYLLRKNTQQLDVVLLNAITSSLKKAGVDLTRTLAQLRQEEHSATVRQCNLLDYYYCSSTGQSQEIMWAIPRELEARLRRRSDYYKAYGRSSRFLFIGEKDHPVKLELTCRTPNAGAVLSLSINQKQVANITADTRWETWDITIPGNLVDQGLNEVVIHWPVPQADGEQPWYLEGDPSEGLPDPFPLFGEIHSLVASEVQKESGDPSEAMEQWNQTRLQTV